MNRSQSIDSQEAGSSGQRMTYRNTKGQEPLNGGYDFGKISLLNQDLLNGRMKCTILFEVFNHNQSYRDNYCGHAAIPASHFATIQNGSHFSIDYLVDTVSKWRMESCRVIIGNGDLIRSFKEMVNSKINSITSSSYTPENVETISTEKKANMLLSNFYDSKRSPYHCKAG